jgi:hypothetical protein
MTTVEKLTRVVKHQSHTQPADHTGVSDHLMHIEEIVLKQGENELRFILGTWNVLAQKFMWYHSGKKPDGSPTPDWYKFENMTGLSVCQLADENLAEQRRRAVVAKICNFFLQQEASDVTVLCLQECEFSIAEEVCKEIVGITAQFDTKGSPGKVTLTRNVKAFSPLGMETTLLMCTILGPASAEDPGIGPIFIANGHLAFKTEQNEKEFQDLKAFANDRPTFVAGDFNIQCMPLSESAKNEGSTKTLKEFVNEVVCAKLGWKYFLAEHELGYTNFNCRGNCADPKRSADHFDNILLLHDGSFQARFIPLDAPSEGVWWNK